MACYIDEGTITNGIAIRVRGVVQGVGFRPTVSRLAKDCDLVGDVLNDGAGVFIRVWGDVGALETFVQRLRTEAPPLSQIKSIESQRLENPLPPMGEFDIIESVAGCMQTAIVADAATCPDCLAEVFDPENRRFRYPFTNCTYCGPRLSIVKAIPYDRVNTSMSSFSMCQACQNEYDDPDNRRFHAQPNACAVCGPRLWLANHNQVQIKLKNDSDAVSTAAHLIKDGNIIAIKGIGGFHLACDATNEVAVAELRRRKQRYNKPFALMARDINVIAKYAHICEEEHALLAGRHAPIVVLEKLKIGQSVADSVAPGQSSLGFMMPYTPMHHILINDLAGPIVLTSGNCSDEPQVIGNSEAKQRLSAIADYWLMHDRDIFSRLDDSVVRVMDGHTRVLRRARGYAPEPLALPPGFKRAPNILAMGAELKNTFCLIKDGQAVLSQHIGDLEESGTHSDYRNNIALYRDLYGFSPETIVVDKHPDYLSTQWGASIAQAERVKLVSVSHHHAHIAACLAENNVPLDSGKVLGIALDGTGMGPDGTLWGGEFLAADYLSFDRLAHFEPIPLLGGAKAIREPWRNTYAHLQTTLGWDNVVSAYPHLPLIEYLRTKPITQLDVMMDRGINTPPAVSVGRLFDAIAAAINVCRDQASYEGQAAIEIEALAACELQEQKAYPYDCNGEYGAPLVLSLKNMWWAMLKDLDTGVTAARISARFHNTLINMVAETARCLATQHNLKIIALSGGVFQNRLLLEGVTQKLMKDGMQTILTHHMVPANDGGLSLGQAAIVAAWQIQSNEYR